MKIICSVHVLSLLLLTASAFIRNEQTTSSSSHDDDDDDDGNNDDGQRPKDNPSTYYGSLKRAPIYATFVENEQNEAAGEEFASILTDISDHRNVAGGSFGHDVLGYKDVTVNVLYPGNSALGRAATPDVFATYNNVLCSSASLCDDKQSVDEVFNKINIAFDCGNAVVAAMELEETADQCKKDCSQTKLPACAMDTPTTAADAPDNADTTAATDFSSVPPSLMMRASSLGTVVATAIIGGVVVATYSTTGWLLLATVL